MFVSVIFFLFLSDGIYSIFGQKCHVKTAAARLIFPLLEFSCERDSCASCRDHVLYCFLGGHVERCSASKWRFLVWGDLSGTSFCCLWLSHHVKHLANIITATDIHAFAVDPKHQGKGAGSALVQAIVDLGNTIGLPIYLEATPTSENVYFRKGFRRIPAEIAQVVHEAAVLGTKEDVEVPLMVKLPQGVYGVKVDGRKLGEVWAEWQEERKQQQQQQQQQRQQQVQQQQQQQPDVEVRP